MTGLLSLTLREQQILRAYPRLGIQKLIAHELRLHQQTVKTHVGSILRKLGCATLGQAAVLFDRWERPGGSTPAQPQRAALRGVKGNVPMMCYCHRAKPGECDCTDARVEAAESRAVFNLRWKADMRAIKQWQKAHPGNDLVWPDHADLVVWLLNQKVVQS